MVLAKNYENSRTIFWDIQKKTSGLFSRHGVYTAQLQRY